MRWVVNATPRPLYPRERPGKHCPTFCMEHYISLRTNMLLCCQELIIKRVITLCRGNVAPPCKKSLPRCWMCVFCEVWTEVYFLINMPLKFPRSFFGDRDMPRQLVVGLLLWSVWFDHSARDLCSTKWHWAGLILSNLVSPCQCYSTNIP
jgi:hypothetical protein